jgi:hypothetical protein
MRLHRVGTGAVALGLAAFVACVGDEPNTDPTSPTNDGGSSSSSGSVGDAPSSDGTNPGTDGGADVARCDPKKAYGDPQPMPGAINTADGGELNISLTDDELIAVIERDQDIYYASRTSKDLPFPAPTFDNVVQISVPGQYEGSPSISGDGKNLYFVRVPTSTGNPTLFVAHRNAIADSFETPVAVKVDGSEQTGVEVVRINRSGSRLQWTCPDCGESYIADRSGGTFDTFVTKRPFASYLVAPAFSGDELTVYFTDFDADAGAVVMRYATRATTGAAFGVNLDMPANLRLGYEPLHVTPDECIFYVRTTKASDAGKFDIWEARRPQ